MPNWRSERMKIPASTSPTICWAPKPSPAPSTDASGTTAEAGRLSSIITQTTATVTMLKLIAHRSAPISAPSWAPTVVAESDPCSSRTLRQAPDPPAGQHADDPSREVGAGADHHDDEELVAEPLADARPAGRRDDGADHGARLGTMCQVSL